ncbi:MAG: PQQ-binding-like beta-propeller repeat protein, partial [Vicinamibacteria bacterium]
MTGQRSEAPKLRPPLRLVWGYSHGFPTGRPRTSSTTTLLLSRGHRCLALESATGKKIWEHDSGSRRESIPAFVVTGHVGIAVHNGESKGMYLVDEQTGKVVHRYRWWTVPVGDEVAIGGGGSYIMAASLQTEEKLWERSFGGQSANWVREYIADDALVVWCQGGGAVHCVNAKTGEPVWETSVADLWRTVGDDKIPGEVDEPIKRFGDVLVLPVHRGLV